MTDEELYMRTLVRESDVIDKTDGSDLAQAFHHLWNKYIEIDPCNDTISRWIPIMEGLPESYNDVLLTICANSAYYGFNKNFAKVKCGQYQPQDDKRDWFVDGVRYYFDNVIAWLPLPEPYKAEGEEQA